MEIRQGSEQYGGAPCTSVRTSGRSRFFSRRIIVIVLIVLALASCGIWVIKSLSYSQGIDNGKYQVVYLSDNQAYFGKLKNIDGDYLYMSTPYIVQNKAALNTTTPADQSVIHLVKVTDQIYGPEDVIAIRTSQVSFWQNLRDDSKITQAIKAKQ